MKTIFLNFLKWHYLPPVFGKAVSFQGSGTKPRGKLSGLIVFALAGGFHLTALCALPPAVVEGVVLRYNKNKVILTQNQGKVRVEVPQSAIVQTSLPLRTGKRVYARLDSLKTVQGMKQRANNEKKSRSKKRRRFQRAKTIKMQ